MNVIGFDDGPFVREHRGDVLIVGAVCARTRLDGVLCGRIRRDGSNATERMVALVSESQFRSHVRAVMLQGIAVGGFNVIDIHALARALGVPVVVIMRRPPDMDAIRRALFSDSPRMRPRVRGARKKWQLIESAGAIERIDLQNVVGRPRAPSGVRGGERRLWVQRSGLSLDAARAIVEATTLHGNVPEPLRLAHLIAGGIVTGQSRGRV